MHSTPTQAISRTSATLAALALAASGLAAVPASAAPASRVVVTSVTGDVAGAVRAVQAAGGKVLDRLALIGGVSATLPAHSVLAPTFRVVPDATLKVAAADTADAAGDPMGVRPTLGLGPAAHEGAGVTVAVVDTGVADVRDLAGRVEHVNVTDGPGGDGYGHGTFVAGLVAGNGSDSDGKYAGVAPGARILDVKVADATGATDLVTVLKGLQAVAAHKGVDVVNLSLSSGSPLPYQIDPLSSALEALWRRGITVVVPAGNEGDHATTITSPGLDPVLLTAGGLDTNGTAAHGDDTVPTWSSRGPAPQGVQKPDLVAPGAHVVSLRVKDSTIDVQSPGGRLADNASYFKGSGTSFSTAVTSGAVAALLGRRPSLQPDQVKSVLTGSAYDASGLQDPNAAGAGGLDVAAAYSTAKGKQVKPSQVDPIPGDAATWVAFLNALIDGDAAAAASSWSKLSPEARNWAASSWSQLSLDARNWAARNWAARNWAGATAEEWAARNWAASVWAARNWAASSWSAGNWAAGNWVAGNWAAGNWAAGNWAARNWAAGNWAAGNWAAGNWAASSWSAGNWAAGNWAAGNWAAGNWAAGNWSARNWTGTFG
jgi:serine protease AprX